MYAILLTMNEVKKTYRINLHYPVAFFSNIINNLIFIAVILLIFSTIFDISNAFTAVLWPFILAVSASGSDSVQSDMQLGTLERIVGRNKQFQQLLLARMMASGLFSFPLVLVFFFLLYSKIDSEVNSIMGLMLILIPLTISSLGLGYLLSAITLYFKEIGSFPNLIMMALLAATMFDWSSINHTFLYILNAVLPFLSIKSFLLEGDKVFLYVSYFNSVLILLIGVIAFNKILFYTKKNRGFGRY